MNRFLMLAVLGLLVLPFAACGPSPEEQAAQDLEDAAEDLEDAANEGAEDFSDAMGAFGEALGNAMGGNADGTDYEPVEREALRDAMPEELNGMERTNIESAREGAMGFTVTHAEAEFQAGEGTFVLKVTDLADVPMIGMMAAWAMAEIDRESGTEIERTFNFNGNRAYEKYNSASESGEMSVLVDGFLVEGRGRNMSRDQIHDAMEDAPIGRLGGLR
ncbi:MAG: hypothetical protein R3284_12485 [Rubricoccaceae bacterium]|nr:hypothetical protein [Rubricoccaceae bacterium]